MREQTRNGRRREAGVAMITVLVALVALMAASALAVDGGLVLAARTQVQNAADASALSGAGNLIDVSGPAAVVTLPAAEAAAIAQGAQNHGAGTASIQILDTDIAYGNWDLTTRTFDTGVDLTDPDVVTAVQVAAKLDDSTTGAVPAFMSRVMGRDDFAVGADAIAYLGWAGGILPGNVLFPIAIDCCKLSGPNCDQDYCATITSNPPNACALGTPQTTGANTVSCLEFNSTPEQNACWTEFDSVNSSINTSSMLDIIQNGQSHQVSTDTPIHVDNGTKTPVVQEIADRFLGEGAYVGNGGGVDRYAPIHTPPVADSWVVGLPVIECQSSDHCAGGAAADVVGAVCFEIREVEVTPNKIIRGRFLCPSDPLFEECDLGLTKSGGLNFGLRADVPVLVE